MIRKLRSTDRADYIAMADEFYSSDAVCHPVPSSNFEAAFDEMMRSDMYAEGYIIEKDGCIAGYALLAKTFSQEAGGMVIWIEEIYIREQYRALGLGGEFFKYIDQTAMKNSVARIRLEVEEDNHRAIRLYNKNGYECLSYMQMKKGS